MNPLSKAIRLNMKISFISITEAGNLLNADKCENDIITSKSKKLGKTAQ